MTLFNKHLFHNWEKFEVYHDCSDISFWSSGTYEYRFCKECNLKRHRRKVDESFQEPNKFEECHSDYIFENYKGKK